LLSQGEGKNMPQHFTLADMWFEIEAQNGILKTRNSLVLLARHMREGQQMTEAKLQARIWLAKHGFSKYTFVMFKNYPAVLQPVLQVAL
jgi:hypothetical protein